MCEYFISGTDVAQNMIDDLRGLFLEKQKHFVTFDIWLSSEFVYFGWTIFREKSQNSRKLWNNICLKINPVTVAAKAAFFW